MIEAVINWVKKHHLITYFVLTYLITFSFGFGLIWFSPGSHLEPWSLVWFFEVFGPTFSAVIVSGIIGGKPKITKLLSGLLRWRINIKWYFAAAFLFLAPLAITQIYRLLGNPVEGTGADLTLGKAARIIIFTLFSGPVAEELGWRGFALPRLQEKHNALVSSLILGVIWTCWHIPLFFITGASQMSIPFPIYLVMVVTVTIYLTWLYNNTQGSMIITIIAHFFYNLTCFLTGVLHPMPPMKFYMSAGPLLGILVVLIVLVFRPEYLSWKYTEELP